MGSPWYRFLQRSGMGESNVSCLGMVRGGVGLLEGSSVLKMTSGMTNRMTNELGQNGCCGACAVSNGAEYRHASSFSRLLKKRETG